MMMNLFSVFDPCSYLNIQLNWVVVVVMMFFIPLKMYKKMSGFELIMLKINSILEKMFKEASYPKFMVLSWFVISVFMIMMIGNLLGMFPYVFVPTSHPIYVMSFGVVLWVSFFLMGSFNKLNDMMVHFVPMGSPIVLSPLMVVIESVSHFIRPFTLSVRLVANMMAGHLIVGLVSSLSMVSSMLFAVSTVLQSLLMALEFGVAVIQAFVFGVLLILYVVDYYWF